MKTIHLFEEGVYLIKNKSVAKCFLFRDKEDCNKFRSKIDHHLSPLCDIMAYGFLAEEFQLVLRLKDRSTLEHYYREKYKASGGADNFVPESTYIFAQAMANLQSGYAKWFNYKYKRDGGLFGSRYGRHLIESNGEVEEIIDTIHRLEKRNRRNRVWTFRRREEDYELSKLENDETRSSKVLYEGGVTSLMACFAKYDYNSVRGLFENLPPKRIPDYGSAIKIKNLVSFMLMKRK